MIDSPIALNRPIKLYHKLRITSCNEVSYLEYIRKIILWSKLSTIQIIQRTP
jgi:hypothetical protein